MALHRRQMDPTWISWCLPHIDFGVVAEQFWGHHRLSVDQDISRVMCRPYYCVEAGPQTFAWSSVGVGISTRREPRHSPVEGPAD